MAKTHCHELLKVLTLAAVTLIPSLWLPHEAGPEVCLQGVIRNAVNAAAQDQQRLGDTRCLLYSLNLTLSAGLLAADYSERLLAYCFPGPER